MWDEETTNRERKGLTIMKAFIFDGDIYCEDCATPNMDGPHADGGGETDTPQHCGECHVFLENPLTSEGVKYVRESHRDNPSDTTREWMAYYELKPLRPTILDEFTEAYVECALWSSSDGDDDRSLGEGDSGSTDRNCRFMTVDDITDDTLAEMVDDCKAFQESFAGLLEQAGNASRNGHDFWLTRNRHGAGFWDRGYPSDVANALTEHSHAYGSYDLYVGDDGKVYA